jgi:hypothetical protein
MPIGIKVVGWIMVIAFCLVSFATFFAEPDYALVWLFVVPICLVGGWVIALIATAKRKRQSEAWTKVLNYVVNCFNEAAQGLQGKEKPRADEIEVARGAAIYLGGLIDLVPGNKPSKELSLAKELCDKLFELVGPIKSGAP